VDRVQIGCNYAKQPFWKIIIGVPLIYVPILVVIPFLAVGLMIVRLHLKLIGAKNLKSYWDFVPAWITHRYTYKTQVTSSSSSWNGIFCRSKLFWIFNCKLYCPLSVALFSYGNYLVKIVENWWCPFAHEKKSHYADGAIDKSFWHIFPEKMAQLHPQDSDNPIWHEQAEKVEATTKTASTSC
jgi:hypothetical protein